MADKMKQNAAQEVIAGLQARIAELEAENTKLSEAWRMCPDAAENQIEQHERTIASRQQRIAELEEQRDGGLEVLRKVMVFGSMSIHSLEQVIPDPVDRLDIIAEFQTINRLCATVLPNLEECDAADAEAALDHD